MKIILIVIVLLFLIDIAEAAVNDVQWGLGSATLYSSTGATITVRWGLGSAYIMHEYISAAPPARRVILISQANKQ